MDRENNTKVRHDNSQVYKGMLYSKIKIILLVDKDRTWYNVVRL